MTHLRVDPWDPEYGGSVEFNDDLEPAPVDFDVEGGAWAARSVPLRHDLPCCAFVDGVRRIDVRLFAEEGEVVAPALAGSWAVGSAWASQPPRIGRVHVGRVLVVGGGMTHPELTASVGADVLRYDPTSVAGVSPVDPIQGLQNRMREAEASAASEVFESGEAELLVLDGPLTYFSPKLSDS